MSTSSHLDDSHSDSGDTNQIVDELLQNPEERKKLIQKLGLTVSESSRTTPSGTIGSSSHAPFLSGKNGGDNHQPALPRGPGPSLWWPTPYPNFGFPLPPPGPAPPPVSISSAGPVAPWPYLHCPQPHPLFQQRESTPVPSTSTPTLVEHSDDQNEEDRLELLSEAEALEFVEFNPSVEPEDAWQPPKQMEAFLEKHFNRALTPSERKAILKDFPKPCSKPLEVPKLDEQVKEHIKGKGKDPHYGQEKSLYKIQEAVLDVSGPLTCLWGDLLNEEAKYSKQDILMLIQHSLVLLGSASHAISQERRKIAWSRINPKLKSLADEDYGKREDSFVWPWFSREGIEKVGG